MPVPSPHGHSEIPNAAADVPVEAATPGPHSGAVTTSPRPGTATSTGRHPLALLGISLGYFMVLLDMTVLSVAEPDLAASLHASIAGLQWTTTGYTVVFGALLLSGGAVADRYGAHRAFRAGVAVFGLGSLLSALAPTLWMLVALRAVLGAAGAACVPASMAMIARLYPDPVGRTRAVATWAAISGSAVAAGPLIGGALVELSGWRTIFLGNVPIAVLVLALTAGRAVQCPRGDRQIDWPAQLAACAVLALLTDGLVACGSRSWAHAAGSGAATVLAAVVLAVLEGRSAAPVLDRAVLRSGGARAGLAVGAAVNFALNGSLFVLPLLLQQGRQLSPLGTGLMFLPLTLPFVLNPPVTGRIVTRLGPRPPILAGMALLTTGGVTLGCAAVAGSGFGWVALGLLLTGFGVSFVLPALVSAVISATPHGTAGAAGGLLNAVRQVGATLGVTTMGAFVGIGTVTGSAYALLLAALVAATAGAWFALATPRPST
jgi:MFS transporter, DHA2 family, methylenomycin A resistance protein